jgi:hypothetical protein
MSAPTRTPPHRLPYERPQVLAHVRPYPGMSEGCGPWCCGLCASRFHAVRGRLLQAALHGLATALSISEALGAWWSRAG